MKRILDFNGFLNESFFGFYLPILFIPLNKNFKCVDPNLTSSKTPFPSERNNTGVAGYLLVPAIVDAAQAIFGPFFKQSTKSTSIEILQYTQKPDQDGYMVMNGGDSSGSKTGVASISAEVPGFGQQAAIYLKTGNAFIAELLMKKSGWERAEIGNLKGKKMSNGFPSNEYLGCEYFGGMDDAISGFREILAASSDNLGVKFKDKGIANEYDVTEELLDLFIKAPGDFMTLNFSEETFNKISTLAKEREPEQNIAQTIDNLSDFKSGGFFED